MILATTVAVDTEPTDKQVHYPQIARFSSAQRRLIYWRCACVFFASAYRAWPAAQRILYTNDDRPVALGGRNLRSFLSEELGVTIVPLEFRRFKTTSSLSRTFRNAFYKHEVLEDLAQRNGRFAILADCDCIWLRSPCAAGFSPRDAIHLLEINHRESMTEEFQGVSRAGMGALFRQIDPLYPNAFPCWFGGELIAGPMERLLQVSRELEQTYNLICHHPELPRLRVFLEYDEWLLSFVIQRQHYHICDASQWFERVWTGRDAHPSLNSLKRSGLHLLAEKPLGFRTIFDDILDRRSKFWSVELDRFPSFLGEFFGVPYRTRWPHYSAAERAVQWLGYTLRQFRFPMPAVVHARISRVARRLISRI